MDEMEIRIEVTSEVFSDRISVIEGMTKRLSHAVESTTGVHAKISLVEPQAIQRRESQACIEPFTCRVDDSPLTRR